MANGDDVEVVDQAAADETAPTAERKPFQPVETAAPAVRQPFQPVTAQPTAAATPAQGTGRQPFQPLGTPAEAAAAQQGWQWASAGGGAPRAELVKLPPLSPAGVASGQAQAFALNQQAGAQAAAAQAQADAANQQAVAQARDVVNSPPGLLEMGNDIYQKVRGNLESLYALTFMQGPDSDDLAINDAVNKMVPEPALGTPAVSPEAAVTGTQLQSTRDALKADLLRADPNTRAQMLSAYLPYATFDPTSGTLRSVDTAALTDSLNRKADPVLQASKAQALREMEQRVKSELEGDPRLKGTKLGNIISAIAPLPAYAVAAAHPEAYPVTLPLIFSRIFSDTRQALAQEHPDWSDEQLDHDAASAATIQTAGAEVGGRIVAAGLGPILRNVRGNYLQRALAHTTAGAVAGGTTMGAAQVATNIALGRPIGESVVEAAIGGAIPGAAMGPVHAIPRPPLAPEAAPAPRAAEPEVTTGPSGARIRGPEERTLEQGRAQAEQPPPAAEQPTPGQQRFVRGPGGMMIPVPEQPIAEQPPPAVPAAPAAAEETRAVTGQRVFSPKFEERTLLSQDQAHGILELHQKFLDDPSYEMTEQEKALLNDVVETRMLTTGNKADILAGRKTDIADFLGAVVNDINRHSAEQPPPVTEPRPLTAADVLVEHPGDVEEAQGDVLNVVAHNIFPELSESEARDLADRVSLLSTRNLETERFRYELEKFLPGRVPYNLGPTQRLLQAYARFRDEPTTYTAKEIAAAERAYNAARGPQAPMPGALKLPIMWREVGPLRGEELPAASVTREDVARRTYEISEQRQRVGQPGDMLSDWAQAQQELSRATEPLPPTQGESEPWVSAIANKHTRERMARGELGEVTPGQGYSTQEMLARGLRMGPEEINQHVSDLMHGTGNLDLQASAVRAKEASLSQRASNLSRIAEANPSNQQARIDADNAFHDVTDFHNGPVATLKVKWSNTGRGLQGEISVDLTTFNGWQEKFLKDNGKPPPPEVEPALRKAAERINGAAKADNGAMQKLGAEIEKQSARRRLPTADEVRNRIWERIKDRPCPT
jgi:hypothetical protein